MTAPADSFDPHGPLDPSRALVPATIKLNARLVRRGFWPKFQRVAARIPFAAEVASLWFAAAGRDTPAPSKAMLLAALAYFVMPLDALPRLHAGAGLHRRCGGDRRRPRPGRPDDQASAPASAAWDLLQRMASQLAAVLSWKKRRNLMRMSCNGVCLWLIVVKKRTRRRPCTSATATASGSASARAAIAAGASRPIEVFRHCDSKAQCAKCVCDLRRMIERSRTKPCGTPPNSGGPRLRSVVSEKFRRPSSRRHSR